ncbi:MAG: tetratricopeptide repeat protein [Parafilimonas sp.]
MSSWFSIFFNSFKTSFQKIITAFLFVVLCTASANAQKVYDFNATCQQAYNEIIALKINSGQQLVNKARQQNPNNLIPDLLDSYIDFFILFFNENPSEFKARKAKFEQRLDRLADGPENSPFYNYCRSAVYLQKACVEIKFGEKWNSGWDFRKAFSLVKDNRKKFPAFLANNMMYGPMQVVAGTIPDSYKWLAGLFGIRGSIKDGMRLMQDFMNSNDSLTKLFLNEASFYYCYILFYVQNKPDEVFQYIAQKNLDIVNNHLLAYMAANLAINNKMNDYAKNIIQSRNHSGEYITTPVWDFEMGYIKMRHLEVEDAADYFENFLRRFKGKFYAKDAYEKLSWCYYLQGNMAAANQARQQILKKGSTETDADKEALKDAKSGIWPNPLLLKARLLNDGGYNSNALALLAGKNPNDFSSTGEKLEFTYRLARIYDDLNRNDEAIKTYLVVINIGEKRQEYYASRAAFQIGNIYENQGKKDIAITYYQRCLNMNDHEYKDSMDQKAKAGIARCRGQ